MIDFNRITAFILLKERIESKARKLYTEGKHAESAALEVHIDQITKRTVRECEHALSTGNQELAELNALLCEFGLKGGDL